MKRIIFTTCLFVVAISALGQIYSNEACFYTRAGEDGSFLMIAIFNGSSAKVTIQGTRAKYKIQENLSKSHNYYENYKFTDGYDSYVYDYSPQKSTSSRVVYMHKRYINVYPTYMGTPLYGMTPTQELTGYDYVAFSPDKSSYITWFEKVDNYNGNISKTYYSRVPKEDLLPKSVNYDFLNE